MTENLSILLGAGISIPAGLPSTDDITISLLKGDNSCPESHKSGHNTDDYHSDNVDYNEYNNEKVELIINYLQLIYSKIKGFYRDGSINYEDIYYVNSQIKDFLIEYENPVVSDFAEDILDQLCEEYNIENKSNWNGKKTSLEHKHSLERLEIGMSAEQNNHELETNNRNKILVGVARLAADYINDLIRKSLQPDNTNIEYLDFIREIVLDEDIDKINIFTLNHDTLMERYLQDQKMDYYDGFISYSDRLLSHNENHNDRFLSYNDNSDIDQQEQHGWKFRFWQAEFLNSPARIRLLKLHGSIDWYKVKARYNDNYGGYFFAQIDGSPESDDFLVEPHPLTLTGRSNKILEYNRSIYVDLHYNFYRILPTANTLLISGYSFNDKGINSWLIDWMYSSLEHKIIFIHPRAANCIEKARPGIKRHWKKWEEEGKIQIQPVAIEEFSWSKFKKIQSKI
ncbi:MAG: SIR2 family protein [Halanaerobiales bacterium]